MKCDEIFFNQLRKGENDKKTLRKDTVQFTILRDKVIILMKNQEQRYRIWHDQLLYDFWWAMLS